MSEQPVLKSEEIRPLDPVASRLTKLPLAGRDRAAWRLAALVLILRACRAKSATLEQLHVLMWALRDERNGLRLQQAWNQQPGAPRVLRAFDAGLEDTLAVAQSSGLVERRANGRIVLSSVGIRLVSAIADQADLMAIERAILAEMGSISEADMWRRLGSPPRRVAESARPT